jgi:hypothetical protein
LVVIGGDRYSIRKLPVHATERYSATNEVAISIGYHTVLGIGFLRLITDGDHQNRNCRGVTGSLRDGRFLDFAGNPFLATICEQTKAFHHPQQRQVGIPVFSAYLSLLEMPPL